VHRLVLPVDEVAGRPASSIFPLRPGCVSRLPLPRSLSAEPASESSGCPSVSSLRLCRRWFARVAPSEHAFGVAGFSKSPSCPGDLPSPAKPAMKDSGCPLSRISGFTGDGSPSRPDARIIRRCRLTGPQVAPSSSPSVSPTIRCPSRPERRILRHRLMDIRVTPDHAPPGSPWLNLQVAPDIFPSATTIDQFPGCPKSWVSHRAPIPRDSSCPESWFLG
jgi:hypothetical protein